MTKTLTQHEQILVYLQVKRSITPFEAFTELGITKLATRISEIRKAGITIYGAWETNEKGARYMRYSLLPAKG